MPTTSREIRLRRRPDGLPRPGDFEAALVDVPEPGPGKVLVRNLWMSVDPYMRGRMSGHASYIAPFEIGRPLEGGAIGRVEASRHEQLRVGDHVISNLGWREAFVSDGAGLRRLPADVAPWQSFLGAFGMPGLTAYVGLLDIGGLIGGETVFVSAAAGAVGSVACQIARIKGCRVVGSAGTDAKVDWLLRQARIEAAFNYKDSDADERLTALCPDGIDLYFDNVGGDMLQAALGRMSTFGRVVLCGAIAFYNESTPPPGPSRILQAIPKRLALRGFIVSDHLERMGAFLEDMRGWVAEDEVVWEETVVEGLENAPRALTGLFNGDNTGKMLVRLAD